VKAFARTGDRALRLLDREKPRVRSDTALMRVLGAAICGTDLRTTGFDFDGTFAEYMEIPAQAPAMGNVLPVADPVSAEHSVLTEPATCCLPWTLSTRPRVMRIVSSGTAPTVWAPMSLSRPALPETPTRRR
jgi:threonine dehydrogenase-like Zn-dependent dehydrogenase